MRGLNMVMLIGNLGADPEVHWSTNGLPITSFRIAVTRTWKDEDGQAAEATQWFPIVCFDKLADIAGEYLRKGSRVYMQGRLRNRSWRDDSGQTHYRTEIVADELLMLDRRRDDESTADPSHGVPTPAPTRPPARNARRSEDTVARQS